MNGKAVWSVAAVATLLAAGAGGFAIAQDGFPGEERTVTERIEVGPVVAREKGPVVKGTRAKPTIATYFAQSATVPAEGKGAVVQIKCPPNTGTAIAGGARTSVGIVLSYLSKGSPDGDSSKRSYYVGVDDNSSTNAAGAGGLVEVQCAKDIRVP